MIDPKVMDTLHPPSFVEQAPGTEEEYETQLDLYRKLRDLHYKWGIAIGGVSFLVFLFFVTYHVISKIRGNEKNTKMNN